MTFTSPVATYRIQLTPSFPFRKLSEIVPYLARLGISHVYLSPIFRAKPGSTHGYDICDFSQVNPELGGEEALLELHEVLQNHGMGIVQDFVPNHMAVESVHNPWWRNMLEHGPASPYAAFFDIDWNPIKPELYGKVLLPFLGDHYGHVLERGELVIEYQSDGFVVRYFDLTRPIDPRQYPRILKLQLAKLEAELGESDALAEFLSIITELEHIPEVTDRSRERIAERLRESKIAKDRLARLVEAESPIREHIQRALKQINGTVGVPSSFDLLHDLLESLPFRLAYWKTAVHEINYRRFFDINQLAGLRVEEPSAFQAMHGLILRLIQEGIITGIRLDHIDGLFDPAGYTLQLQKAINEAKSGTAESPERFYLLVEKILTGDEQLPPWPLHGTTGYEFLNDVSRLFVNPRNAHVLRSFYRKFTDRQDPFRDVVYDCKKLITWTSLAAELNVLADALNRISEGDRRARDFTLDSLREAIREVAVCFPVYRTYVCTQGITERDRHIVYLAIQRAKQRNPAMETSVFDFLRANLLPQLDAQGEELYRSRINFAMKFQQYTGPLQAKGLEDTAFYRYNVLVSLNEVGGDPQRLGGTVAQFHTANVNRQEQTPTSMLATATHDTKRGEDARARLHVLSELPDEWRKRVRIWSAINAGCRTSLEGLDAPDRNDEYLFYQTILGCWPAERITNTADPVFVQRVRDYMLKAIKEAKVHTSWIAPNDEYDQAVARFVEEALLGARSADFLDRFLPFQRKVARAGVINSLAQVVLKSMCPGVPDFYQGTEGWDLSLVDPDNRRPVDFVQLGRLRDEVEPWISDGPPLPLLQRALKRWQDGRIKMYVTAVMLRMRATLPALFLRGAYIPVAVEGPRSEHVVAFLRTWDHEQLLVVVPRWCVTLTSGQVRLPLGPVWGDSRLVLPEGLPTSWVNQLTRRQQDFPDAKTAPLAEIFSQFPVAVLRPIL